MCCPSLNCADYTGLFGMTINTHALSPVFQEQGAYLRMLSAPALFQLCTVPPQVLKTYQTYTQVLVPFLWFIRVPKWNLFMQLA